MNKTDYKINNIACFSLGLLVAPILIWLELWELAFLTMFIGMGLISLYLFYVSTIRNK